MAMLNRLDSFCMDAPTRSVRQERPTCEPCRQRKVRCNRKIPCAHCSRLQLRCTYGQTSRRAPLRGLSKSSPILETHTSPAESSAEPSNRPGGDPSNSEILGRLNTVETLLNNLITSLGAGKLPNIPASNSRTTHQHASSATEPFSGGILVGDAERGSYVDDSVFVNLILDDPSRRANSSSNATQSAHAMPPPFHSSQPLAMIATDVFGPHTEIVHVSSRSFVDLWDIYVQNVDPVMKILHLPTAQPHLLDAAKNSQPASDTTMALLYAVCFAATATISKEEALAQFGYDRLSLLRHFMYRMDQSLMKAKFLIYPDLQTIQSLVIYLTALRTHDTGRPVWVLVGMAIRLAESLGIHRDGCRLGLSPFETEMRYRLWWQLCALESYAPEDYGFDSTILDRRQAFRLPLNIDDSDIFPGMTSLPPAKHRWTEMTFTLINFDLSRNLRQAIATITLKDAQAKEKAIQDLEEAISRRWLQLPGSQKYVCHVAERMLRLFILKSRFNFALQSWLPTCEKTSSTASRYRQLPQTIFTMAVEILEHGYLLQSGKHFHEFAWFFRRHPELYALFLVLHCLKDDPERQEASRAWEVVDEYCSILTDFEEAFERKGRASCVWKILGTLRENAREAYQQTTCSTPLLALGEGSKGNATTATGGEESDAAQGVQPSLPVVWPEMHEFLRQGNLSALNTSTFDNILAWHDFSDWLNLDADASDPYTLR